MNKLERIYARSQNLVEREIEGEIIIVPLTSGIGDLEDELFSLNRMGGDTWARMDSKKFVVEYRYEAIKEVRKEDLQSGSG